MKRFAKTPAIIGGILGCIAAVSSLISLLTIPLSQLQGMNLVTIAFNVLTVLLVSVALLRGKKDVLAGIFFCLAALAPILPIISGIPALGIGMGRMYWYYYGNFENILLVAAFALLALDSFLDLKIPAGTKTLLLVGLVVLHFLLDAVGYGFFISRTYMSYRPGRPFSTKGFIQALPVIIGYIIGVLPATAFRLFAAIAAGKSVVAPAQSTGRYAQQAQYQQPQYQAPQYQQPQYQAPQYQQPQYQAPQYQQPQYQAPQYQQPQYQAPQYQQPQYQAPQYQQPQYQAPQYQQPQYQAPQYQGRNPEEFGYIGLGKHIALSLLTFGIWPIIWVYKTTATLNRAPGQAQQTPINQLLLYLFIPFYTIFWFYKQGQRTDAYAQSAGVPSSCATLCLVMGIFIPIVAVIILQDKINATAQALAR